MSPPSRHVSAHPTHTHLLVFDVTEQRFLFASSAACLQRWWRRSCSFLTAGTQQKSPKNPGNRREFLTSLRIKRPEAGFLLHPTVIRWLMWDFHHDHYILLLRISKKVVMLFIWDLSTPGVLLDLATRFLLCTSLINADRSAAIQQQYFTRRLMANGLTENWRLEAVAVWAANTMRNLIEDVSKCCKKKKNPV